ncbi:hypothetical protein ACH55_09080 [Salmonella enterica subsp. enterica serovar Typhimurium]|nr:hypothetical protein ACH55_09080 [Salmonella enterica subsp. enterica serovar Typhimurium]
MVAPGGDTVFRDMPRRWRNLLQRQRRFRLLLQNAQHPLIDEVVHQPGLMKTHFVLGGMNIDIHLMRVNLQIQHKRRLLVRAQFIFTGLANGMVDQAVAHHAAIHITVLDLR